MLSASAKIRVLIVGTLIAATLTSGCETARNWLSGQQRVSEPDDAVILGAPEANSYLTELYSLASGDPATQAEIFADAQASAQLTPGTSTRLRFALVLATPGHSEADDQQAQRLFRELLAETELMTNAEVSLATIFLNEVESRIVLNNEARRLRSESAQAATSEEAAVAQRITRVEAENRRLRESLADAESKLEAITTIERSIREQAGEIDPR